MIKNYQELKAIVADWLDRPQLASTVPSVTEGINIDLMAIFCAETESKINRELRTEDMVDILFNKPCDEQGMVLLPDNILGMRLVTVNGVDADYLTPEQFTKADEFFCGPILYTRVHHMLHLYPLLTATDDVTIVAYVTIPPLVNDTDTNWLLRKYPDVYLYGCLSAASGYVFDTENEQKWLAKFTDALGALVAKDSADRWSGGTTSIRSG